MAPPKSQLRERGAKGNNRAVKAHKTATIVETDECLCDGYFEEVEDGWDVILAVKGDAEKKAILAVSEYGAGEIIATTIHEYPSEQFIAYCSGR